MFHIKICGITNTQDACAAVAAGVDAVGLNFYRKSPRFVEQATAMEIVAALPATVAKVGVFVNSPTEEVASLAQALGLDWIQLHGEESPQILADLPREIAIARAARCGPDGLEPLARYLATCQSLGRLPDGVLIDAYSNTEYGGTGRLVDWEQIANQRALLGDVPLVLAGGLTPANIREAIATVRPTGVDTASGVESKPGQKDAALMEQFVAAARDAFDSLA